MPYADPEIRRRYHQEWKAKNRGRYQERQKATDAARHANARAEKYGAFGVVTIDEAEEILSSERCHHCGVTESEPWWTIDHLIDLHKGGANRPENMACCCCSCNVRKHRKPTIGSWSAAAPEGCLGCGSASSRHTAKGLCGACYQGRAKALRAG